MNAYKTYFKITKMQKKCQNDMQLQIKAEMLKKKAAAKLAASKNKKTSPNKNKG